MFNFKIHKFSYKNYIISFDFTNIKIISGSFLTEDSIIYENNKLKKIMNDNMEIDSTHVSNSSENETNSNVNYTCLLSILNKEDDKIFKLLIETDFIIITKLEEIILLPYYFKKFSLLLKKNIKVITTEPICQIAKHYLKEFYFGFNKILLEDQYNKCKYENFFCINDEDISEFIENVDTLNYNEKYNLLASLKITLSSSGYELGSSNIILNYYDKKVSILSKWNYNQLRYPKVFDYESLKDSNILICLPETINFSNDYEYQVTSLINEINKITGKSDPNSNFYPNIYMPTDWNYLLEFVDLIRYRFNKETKNIYLSNSIKAILEYANISHGFINPTIQKKILDFKLPFNFDELIKNERLFYFNDFEEFMKSTKNKITHNNTIFSDSPNLFMVNRFNFNFGDNIAFEYFLNNSKSSDYFINLSKDTIPKLTENQQFKVKNYHLDNRGNLENFEYIMNDILKPEQFYYYEQEAQNTDYVLKFLKKTSSETKSYNLNAENFVNFQINDINYDKVYYVAKDKNEFENLLLKSNKDYCLEIEQENDNLLVTLTPEIKLYQNKNEMEIFEQEFNLILSYNDMKVNEILFKEDKLHIHIVKINDPNSNLEVILCNSEIKINSENSYDAEYLNRVILNAFNF